MYKTMKRISLACGLELCLKNDLAPLETILCEEMVREARKTSVNEDSSERKKTPVENKDDDDISLSSISLSSENVSSSEVPGIQKKKKRKNKGVAKAAKKSKIVNDSNSSKRNSCSQNVALSSVPVPKYPQNSREYQTSRTTKDLLSKHGKGQFVTASSLSEKSVTQQDQSPPTNEEACVTFVIVSNFVGLMPVKIINDLLRECGGEETKQRRSTKNSGKCCLF